VLAIVAVAALLLAVALLLPLACGHRASVRPSAALELLDGVPVGVEHSPAGALAAADEYLAVSSQQVEQNPAVFAELVAQAYAVAVRSRVLSEAQQLRSSDTRNMANYAAGGRGLALVAARRLNSYAASTARVTSWLEGIVWGPHLAPRQTWNLVDTTLSWSGQRWLVLDSHVDPEPAPVPAVVYVQGANDTAGSFTQLDAMSNPIYGADK